MVVYSILLMDLSGTSLLFTQALNRVWFDFTIIDINTISSYSDQRKSYSGYVGVGLGVAHSAYLNARRRFCTCRL